MAEINGTARVRRLITDTLPTLTIQTKSGVYPYQLDDGPPHDISFSISTNSMVVHSLACAAGLLPESVVAVTAVTAFDDPDERNECMVNTLRRIISHIASSSTTSPYYSSSFGLDDPLTLLWLKEIFELEVTESAGSKQDYQTAKNHLTRTIDRRVGALDKLAEPVFHYAPKTSDHSAAVVHPLPVLRMAQLGLQVRSVSDAKKAELFEWFLNRMYLQLSRRMLGYNDSDIADIIFCLEGLLVVDPQRVVRSLVEKVCGLIDEVRTFDPTLRPVTPFKTSEAGAVHLFSSVEVFSSLLRIARRLELLGQVDFFSTIQPAFEDYVSWLQDTKIRGRLQPVTNNQANQPPDSFPDDVRLDYAGWQSEYSHATDRAVHVWLTSQVDLFLLGYDLMLTRANARRALDLVELHLDAARPLPEQVRDIGARIREAENQESTSLEMYQVYTPLNEDFILPRLGGNGREAKYSCLVYGPSGTGKTTLARWVADRLGWPLLTVTTSDFIIDGEAQVEARAKRLFNAFEQQRETVIFFDEIDRLVLDRNAIAYARQGDMLQFMTPSMLSKIYNLRAKEQVVFIIGTNYADLIDEALKKDSWIDSAFLLLPPDRQRRQRILGDIRNTPLASLRDAAEAAAGLTVSELETAARRYSDTDGSLSDYLRGVPRNLSLRQYKQRIDRSMSDRTGVPREDADMSERADLCPKELIEEACLLAYLELEGGSLPVQDLSWLRTWWAARGRNLVQDLTVQDRLDTALTK